MAFLTRRCKAKFFLMLLLLSSPAYACQMPGPVDDQGIITPIELYPGPCKPQNLDEMDNAAAIGLIAAVGYLMKRRMGKGKGQ